MAGPVQVASASSGRSPAGPKTGGRGPASGSGTEGNGAKMRSCGFSRCQGFDPEYGQVPPGGRTFHANFQRPTSNAQATPNAAQLPIESCWELEVESRLEVGGWKLGVGPKGSWPERPLPVELKGQLRGPRLDDGHVGAEDRRRGAAGPDQALG